MRLLLSFCFCLISHLSFSQNWQIIWEDNFDGSQLDLSKWTHDIGSGSQFGLWGWGNGELQFYQSENTELENGIATITVKEEPSGLVDSWNNSFYYSTNQNDIKDNCELNLVMAVPGEENKKRKKICFKTEPYQTVELPKLTLGPDNCEENQIKMLDQNTSLGNGNYNFCSSQEHNSQNVRNKMIPSNPIFNTPYHPLPLPHQDENEPLFAS